MAQLAPLGQPFGRASQTINAPTLGPRFPGLQQGASDLSQALGTFLTKRKQDELEDADRAALAELGNSPPGQLNDEQTAKGFADVISNFGSTKFKGIADQIFTQRLARQADPTGQLLREAELAKITAEGGQIGQPTPQTPEETAATEALTAERIARTGQIGKAAPLSPEDRALKIAQANKLLKETDLLETTLTEDEKRRRDLIEAGLSPKAISKLETELLKSQIGKNRAEANKLLRESNGELTPEDSAAQSTVLRKEFNALSKDFFKSRDAFARVKASAKDPSAAGDLALIFNFMKVLDPGSVVRESEFANAAATGSLGERWKGIGAKLLRGERVSKIVRQDFVDRATRLFKSQEGNQGKLTTRYTALSKRFGVDPAGVVDASPEGEQVAPLTTTPTVSPQDMTPEQRRARILELEKKRG
jgi:hypothetical protein